MKPMRVLMGGRFLKKEWRNKHDLLKLLLPLCDCDVICGEGTWILISLGGLSFQYSDTTAILLGMNVLFIYTSSNSSTH